jgi:hypothetical protein
MVNWELEVRIERSERLTLSVSIFWNASDNCLITTQALTNRSKVMPAAWPAGGGRPPNPGMLGAAVVGTALNMSSPEEDTISDYRFSRARQAQEKGKGITVFPLDELEKLRG